jgi:hypothetical protein
VPATQQRLAAISDVAYSTRCGTSVQSYTAAISGVEQNLRTIVRRVHELTAGHPTTLVARSAHFGHDDLSSSTRKLHGKRCASPTRERSTTARITDVPASMSHSRSAVQRSGAGNTL